MTDVIYENPAYPLPEWARWLAKGDNSYVYCFQDEPFLTSYGWGPQFVGNSTGRCELAQGYAIEDDWQDSLRRIIRLGDPAYYVPENPHTDDHEMLPHDHRPMPEWCRGKVVCVESDMGFRSTADAEGFDWYRIRAYRIVADAAQGKHPSHETRSSDASSFDEICTKCGATDVAGGGWGRLAEPCPRQDDSGGQEAGDLHIDRQIREMGRKYGVNTRDYYIGALEAAYREVEAIEQAIGVDHIRLRDRLNQWAAMLDQEQEDR